MPETLLILRSQQLGVSTAAVLLLWAALHVVRSSASFAGGRLTDRIGASRTMWLGWLAYAGVAAGFAVARGAGAAWTLFLAFGIVAGLTESPERTLVAQFAGGHHGSGFGMYHSVTGLAADRSAGRWRHSSEKHRRTPGPGGSIARIRPPSTAGPRGGRGSERA